MLNIIIVTTETSPKILDQMKSRRQWKILRLTGKRIWKSFVWNESSWRKYIYKSFLFFFLCVCVYCSIMQIHETFPLGWIKFFCLMMTKKNEKKKKKFFQPFKSKFCAQFSRKSFIPSHGWFAFEWWRARS